MMSIKLSGIIITEAFFGIKLSEKYYSFLRLEVNYARYSQCPFPTEAKHEMYQYRQVLARMRLGDSDREIAKAGLMGRRKVAALRQVALAQGWLNQAQPIPDEATLAVV